MPFLPKIIITHVKVKWALQKKECQFLCQNIWHQHSEKIASKNMKLKKAMSKLKKKKEINWNIFTKKDLIKITERYKKITKEKKKKKMEEAKNLDLQIFKLVILLGISKSRYYKNQKKYLQIKKKSATRTYNNKGLLYQ